MPTPLLLPRRRDKVCATPAKIRDHPAASNRHYMAAGQFGAFAAMPLALSDSDPRAPLLDLLDRHRAAAPETEPAVSLFREFALAHADCLERSCVPGHLTGSGWLVDRTGRRVLLTHHRKLNKWLQLGGHADGDGDLARVALREAEEESGLGDLAVEPAIFDLDRHMIPARGNEPAHWHYDVRFVVRATGSEAFTLSDESHALAWRAIADIAADSSVDESVRRMAHKWLERSFNTIPTQPSP
jgi:8-oxo-dGTP pyrophosphatase MutT (NUDIX family)